jgi:hypothetical protein
MNPKFKSTNFSPFEKKDEILKGLTNLGYGDPLMGFWPYFLLAHMSEERFSAET